MAVPPHTVERLEGCEASAAVQAGARELLPMLYAEVRRIARRERRRVGAGATLQTTALVHEAWLKFDRSAHFADRAHFLHAAALAMRHVLVNHAREAHAAKRGGGAEPVSLGALDRLGVGPDETLIEVHEALLRLAALNPRLAQVVECRYFGGLDARETAEALGVTERTVGRDWVKARAWLHKELRGHDGASDGG